MPFFNTTEQNAQKNELALKKLMLEIERLEQETAKIFHELKITPEQFKTYTSNPANFTTAEWEMLQDQRKKLDEKLDLSANQFVDPSKTAKTRSEMNISQNWLFVR